MNKIFSELTSRNFLIATTGLVIVIMLIVGGLHMMDTNRNQDIQETTSEEGGYKVNISNAQGTEKSTPPGDTETNYEKPPEPPYGAFISSHNVNINSEAAGNMNSVCRTTPGAQCTIKFSKNDEIRQLPVQSADESGSTQWYWSLKEIGLTEGTWKVEAIASNGDQEEIVEDPIKLRIQT